MMEAETSGLEKHRLPKKINLLISVRDLHEARIAAQCDVPVIDLKEPSRGSLGAVDQEIAKAIASQIGDHSPSRFLSVAMGEMMDWRSEPTDPTEPAGPKNAAMDRNLSWLNGFDFAKIGLANTDRKKDWQSMWVRWAAEIREHCQPVVVAYADYKTCNAPHPEEIIEFACEVKPAFWLIDTFAKDGRNLLDHVGIEQLEKWFASLRRRGIGIAVAGSLDRMLIETIAALHPDIVAVRGAACRGNERTDKVCRAQLVLLLNQIDRLNRRF